MRLLLVARRISPRHVVRRAPLALRARAAGGHEVVRRAPLALRARTARGHDLGGILERLRPCKLVSELAPVAKGVPESADDVVVERDAGDEGVEPVDSHLLLLLRLRRAAPQQRRQCVPDCITHLADKNVPARHYWCFTRAAAAQAAFSSRHPLRHGCKRILSGQERRPVGGHW